MHPCAPQIQQAPCAYPQPAAYVRQAVPTPGTAVTSLVLSILVLLLNLLLSPLTLFMALGMAATAADIGVSGTSELIGLMIVAFMPIGAPAILGVLLSMHPRTRMPQELFPVSGVRTAATVFLVLHLLTLLAAVILGLLPQLMLL